MLGTVLLTAFAVFAPGFGAVAGASSGPFTPSTVTTTSTTDVICRANGGSLSANTEADQVLGSTVIAPDAVTPGQSFDIKIKQPYSSFPSSDSSTGISATIVAIYNQISRWQLPSGLTINSVSLAPIDGNTGANADAGYYVAPGNIPAADKQSNGEVIEGFDPLTLPASSRVAVPGTPPAALFDPSTNIVRTGMIGTGTESAGTVYAGGSIVQAPAVTIHVTASSTIAAGTDLGIKMAGSLPAGTFTGSEPGNFPAPAAITVNQAALTSSDTVWTDPSYVNYVYTTALGGFIKIVAKAACAPGYESNTDLGTTPPDYYTGPNAIPNGTAPLVDHTTVIGIGSTAPFDGANYLTGSSVTVAYSCIANPSLEPYDTCVGDQPNGSLLDTSTPGPHTFTINATDAFQDPISRTINYNVADPLPPVANAGAPQTGKVAGSVVTLDGSGSTDPNGPPSLPLTYTWSQTGGPAVTLSNPNAVKPTFTVQPVDSPAGNTYSFSLTVDNGYLHNTATTTVTSAPSTPTVTVAKARPGGGTTFYEGDIITLTANITNPDGNNAGDYTYAWSQNTGITTTLSSTTAANPTYKIPPNGTAACASGTGATNCPTFKVIVTKTNTAKSSASAALGNYASTLPTTPVANAGAAQTLPNSGGTATLDGSASTQAQGHTISYAWTQTGGPTVTLSDPTAQKPTFTAAGGGGSAVTYTFSLVVKDTQNVLTSGGNTNTSTASTTTVSVVPDHVVANNGTSQTGKIAGNTITLDASGSTDPNNAPLSYTWTQVNNGAPTATLSDVHAVKPTFVAPPAAAPSGYVAQFNVTATNGGPNPGDTDTTTTPVGITVAASTPTVAAPTKARDGGGTSFFTGDRITLSVAITNPDGTNPGDYSYVWAQSSGVTTALSSTTAANPTYIIPPQTNGTTACVSGTGTTGCPEYKVTVTKINTGKASAQSASLANYASTLATRPVASAGTAQGVKVASTVTLDGSGSTQAQGHPLSYAWTQSAGPAVTLSSSTVQQPTFTASSTPTSYTFSLTVTDTQNAVTGSGTNGKTSTASTVVVTVGDYASPSASAGSDQNVHVADPVTLSGSASQADGHTLTYSWSQTSGPAVTLTGSTTLTPSFTAPSTPASLQFKLTATDTQNPNPAAASTTSSAVTITVADYASPSVSSGSPQSVHVTDPVQLNGSASQSDGHTLVNTWTQTAGTAVTLSNIHALNPTFTAPAVPTSLQFQLSSTDTQNPDPAVATTTSSTVTITVAAFDPPIANAGPDQSGVRSSGHVTLDGSGSHDPDGFSLTYTWLQTSGPTVTLSDAHAKKPTFVAPVNPSTLSFQLTVDNGFFSGTASDSVSISVAGTPGLDFGAATKLQKSGVQGQANSDNFNVTVTNDGQFKETVTSSMVYATVTVNSVDVSSDVTLKSRAPVALAPGESASYGLTWTHGDTLNIGDAIVITGCVAYAGDSVPANNCSVIQQPAIPINVGVQGVTLTKVIPTTTSSIIGVTVRNAGSQEVSPLRPGQVVVTVTVGSNAPISLPTAGSNKLIAAGGATSYKYTWSHGSIPVGTVITVTATVNITGNTSASSTNTGGRTVTVK